MVQARDACGPGIWGWAHLGDVKSITSVGPMAKLDILGDGGGGRNVSGLGNCRDDRYLSR